MLISISDLIEGSYKFYASNRQLFFTYVKYLLLTSIGFLVIGGGGALIFFALSANSAPAWTAPILIGAGVLLFIALIFVSLWISLSLIRSGADFYENQPAKTAREQMKLTTVLVWPIILVSLLTALAVVGGFILLVIPGVIFSIWFAFATYAVALDNERGIAALAKSKSLVRGRWWPVFWRLLVLGILFSVLLFVLPSLVALPFALLSQATKSSLTVSTAIGWLGQIVGLAVSAFLTPFPVLAHTLFYLELKKTPATTKTEQPAPTA